eukprot:SAG22_NODE_2189_length_2863_cov_3.101664_4_plen_102_part_00
MWSGTVAGKKGLDADNQLVFSLGHGAVGLQEQATATAAGTTAAVAAVDSAAAPPTVAAIEAVINAAKAKEYASYKGYGEYAEVKEGLQVTMMVAVGNLHCD